MQTAVVTGAGRGIGRELARRLAARGLAVLVTDLDADAAEKVAAELGEPAWSMPLDVRDPAAHRTAAAAAAARGAVTVWVNSAGVLRTGPAWTQDDDDVRLLVESNVLGAVWGTNAAIGAMRNGGGVVVNVASLSALGPAPDLAVYAATQHAVLGFTLTTACDLRLARRRIRVHAVSADGVAPPMSGPRTAPRGLTPAQVADCVVALLDDAAPVVVLPRWRGWALRAMAAFPRAAIVVATQGARLGERRRRGARRKRLSLRHLVERRIAEAVAALPVPVQRVLAGRPVRIEGQVLHPEVQLMLRLLRLTTPSSIAYRESVAKQRARVARESALVGAGPLPVASVRDLRINGPAGLLPARLYVPGGAATPGPLLVFYHGGGFVVGDLETHDPLCRFLAREAGIRVLAVDYRRAPEHAFPAAHDDALAAFAFAVAHAAQLGADPSAIAVGGDSAGGNLAAVVARETVAAGGPAPAFQLLLYPMTDMSRQWPSRRTFAQGFYLSEWEIEWFSALCLAGPGAAFDLRVSPLLADDLHGLPPAHVVTAGFDPLRDEGEAYAHRLRDAGVPVTLKREADLVHGFANAVTLGRRPPAAMRAVARALREGTAR